MVCARVPDKADSLLEGCVEDWATSSLLCVYVLVVVVNRAGAFVSAVVVDDTVSWPLSVVVDEMVDSA